MASGPKTAREMEIWTQFAAAALSSLAAGYAGKPLQSADHAASAADTLLDEWRKRMDAVRTEVP